MSCSKQNFQMKSLPSNEIAASTMGLHSIDGTQFIDIVNVTEMKTFHLKPTRKEHYKLKLLRTISCLLLEQLDTVKKPFGKFYLERHD